MGDKINPDAYEAGAKVMSNGKYLFFVRNMDSDTFATAEMGIGLMILIREILQQIAPLKK